MPSRQTTEPVRHRRKVDVTQARQSFAELVSQVGFGHERVILCRNGKEVAALLPLGDLEFLEHLEDQYDLAAAKEARGGKSYTSDEVRKMLGIK